MFYVGYLASSGRWKCRYFYNFFEANLYAAQVCRMIWLPDFTKFRTNF